MNFLSNMLNISFYSLLSCMILYGRFLTILKLLFWVSSSLSSLIKYIFLSRVYYYFDYYVFWCCLVWVFLVLYSLSLLYLHRYFSAEIRNVLYNYFFSQLFFPLSFSLSRYSYKLKIILFATLMYFHPLSFIYHLFILFLFTIYFIYLPFFPFVTSFLVMSTNLSSILLT